MKKLFIALLLVAFNSVIAGNIVGKDIVARTSDSITKPYGYDAVWILDVKYINEGNLFPLKVDLVTDFKQICRNLNLGDPIRNGHRSVNVISGTNDNRTLIYTSILTPIKDLVGDINDESGEFELVKLESGLMTTVDEFGCMRK